MVRTSKVPEEVRGLVDSINQDQPRESATQTRGTIIDYCMTCNKMMFFKYIGSNYYHSYFECPVCKETLNRDSGGVA